MMKVADDQNNTLNSTELVLFKDGDVSLEVPVIPEEDTVWLSQAQMVELYSRDVSVISRHIRNIFKEGELDKESNLHFLQIANADRPVAFYSLDVIISVGYRVKSHRGIAFRKWANRVLKQYILRGYAVNDNRMKQLGEVVRLMKRTQESLDSKQVLTVIENYSRALELLDDYDHQTMKRPKGTSSTYVLTYEECRRVIDQMCRKRQLICCILLRKTIASGMEIKESQQQCFCIFWTETAFSTMKQGTNDWMIIRLLL